MFRCSGLATRFRLYAEEYRFADREAPFPPHREPADSRSPRYDASIRSRQSENVKEQIEERLHTGPRRFDDPEIPLCRSEFCPANVKFSCKRPERAGGTKDPLRCDGACQLQFLVSHHSAHSVHSFIGVTLVHRPRGSCVPSPATRRHEDRRSLDQNWVSAEESNPDHSLQQPTRWRRSALGGDGSTVELTDSISR